MRSPGIKERLSLKKAKKLRIIIKESNLSPLSKVWKKIGPLDVRDPRYGGLLLLILKDPFSLVLNVLLYILMYMEAPLHLRSIKGK